MDETLWEESNDPQAMLEYLQYTASDRKSRLIACACCRAFHDVLDAGQCQAVSTAELFAEGRISPSDFMPVSETFGNRYDPFFEEISVDNAQPGWAIITDCLVSCACIHPEDQAVPWAGAADAIFTVGHVDPAGLRIAGCHLVRCIFGNPFRPVTFDPVWGTSTVLALAQQMYDSRDFSPMPILADALQDAGCENTDILDHCRGPGPHVRGCWVVDLVLGKS